MCSTRMCVCVCVCLSACERACHCQVSTLHGYHSISFWPARTSLISRVFVNLRCWNHLGTVAKSSNATLPCYKFLNWLMHHRSNAWAVWAWTECYCRLWCHDHNSSILKFKLFSDWWRLFYRLPLIKQHLRSSIWCFAFNLVVLGYFHVVCT